MLPGCDGPFYHTHFSSPPPPLREAVHRVPRAARLAVRGGEQRGVVERRQAVAAQGAPLAKANACNQVSHFNQASRFIFSRGVKSPGGCKLPGPGPTAFTTCCTAQPGCWAACRCSPPCRRSWRAPWWPGTPPAGRARTKKSSNCSQHFTTHSVFCHFTTLAFVLISFFYKRGVRGRGRL
jgi:hypothetical protein